MVGLDTLQVRGRRFSADGDLTERTVWVRLVGEADAVSLEEFADLMERLRRLTRTVDVEEVVLDFRKLEWLTARCISGLVDWISEAGATRPMRIRMLSNPGFRWQRRTLHALQCFAPSLVTVE